MFLVSYFLVSNSSIEYQVLVEAEAHSQAASKVVRQDHDRIVCDVRRVAV